MRGALYRDIWHAARACLLVLAAIGGAGVVVSQEPAVVAAKKDQPAPKITFSPQVEEKLKDYIAKVGEARRKVWRERMQKEIEKAATLTGLSPESKKALEAPAQLAADVALEGWTVKFDELFRRQWKNNSSEKQMLRMLVQMLPQAELYAREEMVGESASTDEQPGWLEALRRTLTPEQFAKWDKAQSERKNSVEAEIGDMLKASAERTREQYGGPIRTKVAELKAALSLPKERVEKLEALAKSATDQAIEDWMKGARKSLISMPDAKRAMVVKQRQFYFGIETKSLPLQQPVWKDGLAAFLSPEEMKRLQTMQEEQKLRRGRIMAQTMLTEMDAKIAFTAEQRVRLLPIAERLVKDQPALFPESTGEEYISFSPGTFFSAGASATPAELQAILDPIQCKRWQESCSVGNIQVDSEGLPEPPMAVPTPPSAQPPEPEEFENAISDFLCEKTVAKRKEVATELILKAEDAARIANLPAERVARLQTAARGAMEETLAAWRLQVEQIIRSNLNSATAANIRQRLASMEDYYFRQRPDRDSEKNTVWEKTVKAELSAEQHAAWRKELDARRAFREKAIAATVLIEFDRKTSLNAVQWEKLEPMVARIVKEYSPDISGYFTFSGNIPWYLQYYSKFIPIAGVPEKEMKALLTTEQWDRWTASNEYGNTLSYWENLKENHEQRVKQRGE